MKEDINGELIAAARDGNENAVARLLDRGADVNVKNEGGFTPLGFVKKISGNKSVIQVLRHAEARQSKQQR